MAACARQASSIMTLALMESMSTGRPAKSTGTAISASKLPMFQVPSMSLNLGLAPMNAGALLVAAKVSAVVVTRGNHVHGLHHVLRFTPATLHAAKSAEVPLLTAREYLEPTYSENCDSNSRTFGPWVSQSEVRTSETA